jgi:hypothetical protein
MLPVTVALDGSFDSNMGLGGEVYNTNGFRSGFDATGIFSFWTSESGGTIALHDATIAPIGTCQQFGITFGCTTAKLYRNEAYVTQNNGTYIAESATNMSTFGASTVRHFYGLFDQVYVYNYALSGSAIMALYNSDAATPTPPPTAMPSATPTFTPTSTPPGTASPTPTNTSTPQP